MEKSVVLIDAENILRSWARYCRKLGANDKIDYLKLVANLSENTNLLRAYFYDGVPEVIPTRKKIFLDVLCKNGIQLRIKVLRKRQNVCTSCGNKEEKLIQKGVDVSIATDVLRHAWQKTCDICIIASGDEDYKDAIEVAKDKGIKIWVASFKANLSRELELSADRVILLDNLFDNIKRKI